MSNPIHPTSQTPQQLTLTKLKQLMPEAFSEGQLDIHKLTALLSEQDIAPAQEAYGLSWAGKHQVYRELKTPTSQTLVPQPDESVDFDTSQNLFIEGDNLAVLKILQKSYHSRIKMIYIDPPYNTGNDRFVYADDFSESIADYKARAGQTDADGNLTHSDGMRGNRKENGQYHSNWLNMMYPRLALAKSLLREDGVIFVSIDDNEVANLRLLMDEIFGEENFAGMFPWKKRTAKSDVSFGISQDYEWLLCYARQFFQAGEVVERKYHYTEDYKNDGWRLSDLTKQTSASERPNSAFDMIDPKTKKIYPFNPNRTWSITRDTFEEYYNKGKVVFPDDYDFLNITIPSFRVFESEDRVKALEKFGSEKPMKAISTFLPKEVGMSEGGNKEIVKLFNQKLFSYPKPSALIKRLVSTVTDNEDIVLDFFAGSSTTAHAVMALNAEDAENGKAGKRKFIMVQIPEVIDAKDNQSAYEFCINNNMPPNIAEISKERIRRAAAHITSELPETVDSTALDFGFKAYKLADSNFIPWQQPASYDADSLMAQLEKHLDPIVDTATTDGIITELMLKEGYTLTATVREADGYYLLTQNDAPNDGLNDANRLNSAGTSMTLAIVLDDMTTSKATQIIASAPNKTLIMDRAFSDDANKANIVLQFEDAGLVVGCV